jgi:hypothetical protein
MLAAHGEETFPSPFTQSGAINTISFNLSESNLYCIAKSVNADLWIAVGTTNWLLNYRIHYSQPGKIRSSQF